MKPKLLVPRTHSYISGQRMMTVLFDGWYEIAEKWRRPTVSWEAELNGIMARQRGRRDPSITRGLTVSRMAFEVAVNDVDRLLGLIAAEFRDLDALEGKP